ncbi:hypothetical protein SteCoe_33041 [Stentor coeruleus]|uniref:Kinesin motor domain-containing protein n=1 Tax=Stentor coeruleus TaxID=5963 RepID=A0A1R2AY17_9CILI|nr:hypothetical protein SteCoe_33041 [Stentor coeruleus]
MDSLTPHMTTIQVFLRFRPLSIQEKANNEQNVWKVSHSSICLSTESLGLFSENKRPQMPLRVYNFTECFNSGVTNAMVHEKVSKPLLSAVLEGYNSTIFAYGQTGSGKTYTMLGLDSIELSKHRRKRSMSPFIGTNSHRPQYSTKGILFSSLKDLFSMVSSGDKVYSIVCSYMEIYNENVFDLLSDQNPENLTVNEDPNKGFYVKGLSEKVARNIEEVVEIVNAGENWKKYGNNEHNSNSSRSHTIFRAIVTGIKEDNTGFESFLHFVDLAGSERISNSKKAMNPETVNEGKHINTSLFYLCSVIHKLSEKPLQHTHIPYRNSNLTKLLKHSIGGNSFTSIICTASPSFSSYEMTSSTLHLASLARTITNRVSINTKSPSPTELLKIYHGDIRNLRAQIIVQKIQNSKVVRELEEKVEKASIPQCECKIADSNIEWIYGVGDVLGGKNANKGMILRSKEKKKTKCLNCQDHIQRYTKILEEHKELEEKYQKAIEYLKELKEKNEKLTERHKKVQEENDQGQKSLTDMQKKIEISINSNEENSIKYNNLLLAYNNLQNTSLEYEKLLDKYQMLQFEHSKCEEYFSLLEDKLAILEGRCFKKLSDKDIRVLEKFYLEVLDLAKEERIHKQQSRKVLGEIFSPNTFPVNIWEKLSDVYKDETLNMA